MKLLNRGESNFTFLIGKRERELMFSLLRRYPVIIGGHFRARHPARANAAKKGSDLLEEALADIQKENRQNLELMLNEPGRFKDSEMGYSFSLTSSEMEWLLQVFNDIRVGSWIQLGEPDSNPKSLPQATEESVQLAWAMEMAGLFEHSLLEAIKSADQPE